MNMCIYKAYTSIYMYLHMCVCVCVCVTLKKLYLSRNEDTIDVPADYVTKQLDHSSCLGYAALENKNKKQKTKNKTRKRKRKMSLSVLFRL